VRLRWLLVVFVLVGAVGLLLVPRPATPGGYAPPLAVFATLLAAAVAVPLVLGPLGRLAGLLVAPFLPLEERLTRGALVRDRSRAALTVGALAVAVAMIVALGGVGASARSAAETWLAEVVPGSEVLVSIRPVAIDEPLLDDLRAVAGVERVSPIGRFAIAAGGYRLDAAAISGADYSADGRLRFVAGDAASALAALDAGGAAILPRARAEELGLGVDGTLTATTADGPVALRVAGVVERSVPGEAGEAVLVGWPDASRLGALGADLFAVRYAAGAEATSRPALDEVALMVPLQPAALEDVRGAVGAALGRLFGLLDGLALVALVVAALGIVNTLTMNVIERVREIGVLRAAGLTRRQVWRMVVVEAAILGLVGAAVGAVAGLAAAGVLVVAGGGAAPAFDPGWSTLVLAVVGGVALATLAAVYPARVAGRIEIVRAVTYE
jgi:putative ABC transport system permease protein